MYLPVAGSHTRVTGGCIWSCCDCGIGSAITAGCVCTGDGVGNGPDAGADACPGAGSGCPIAQDR